MSRSTRQRHRRRHRAAAAHSGPTTQPTIVGTVAAAALAGVSRRTLARRAAAGELPAGRDARGRLVFAADALADVDLRPAGRPRTAADATVAAIVALRARGLSLRAIAAQLELERVPP